MGVMLTPSVTARLAGDRFRLPAVRYRTIASATDRFRPGRRGVRSPSLEIARPPARTSSVLLSVWA